MLSLPDPETIPNLSLEQTQRTVRLTGILSYADSVLLPNWQFRARATQEILRITGGSEDWDTAVASVVGEQVGLTSPRELSSLIKSFRETTLGLFLIQSGSYATGPNVLMKDWASAVRRGDTSVIEATVADPEFAKSTYMLGTEVACNQLTGYLDNAANGQFGVELCPFIGDSDEKTTEARYEDLGDVDETLDRLNQTVRLYERLVDSGSRPIDPERLVGVCKVVMGNIGLVPKLLE